VFTKEARKIKVAAEAGLPSMENFKYVSQDAGSDLLLGSCQAALSKNRGKKPPSRACELQWLG
jgi:hypothetical protein